MSLRCFLELIYFWCRQCPVELSEQILIIQKSQHVPTKYLVQV